MGDNQKNVAKELFAGAMGGVIQVLSGQPFDTVKVRLQTQPGSYSGLIDCVSKTYKSDGVSGFYRGTLTPRKLLLIQFLASEPVFLFNSRLLKSERITLIS